MKERIIKTFHVFGFITTSLFIIISSLFDGSSSSMQSKKIADIIYRLFNYSTRIEYAITFNKFYKYKSTFLVSTPLNFEFFLRKSLGHFLIFFILAYFTSICLFFYDKKIKNKYLAVTLYGLIVAIISELLQFIPKNRGPSLKDVIINLSGFISFILIFSFVRMINIKFQTNKHQLVK